MTKEENSRVHWVEATHRGVLPKDCTSSLVSWAAPGTQCLQLCLGVLLRINCIFLQKMSKMHKQSPGSSPPWAYLTLSRVTDPDDDCCAVPRMGRDAAPRCVPKTNHGLHPGLVWGTLVAGDQPVCWHGLSASVTSCSSPPCCLLFNGIN